MVTSSFDVSRTVAECSANHPRVSQVFGRHKIDLCRDGKKTLSQVCHEQNIQPQQLVEELMAAARLPHCEIGLDGEHASISELCEHIETAHHLYLRRELPTLLDLVRKVVKTYRSAQPELDELQGAFERFRESLEQHLLTETTVLLPALRELETNGTQPGAPVEHLPQLIAQMESDHALIDSELQQIRRLTKGYTLPPGACATYEAMLDSLWELEGNLHQKMHEESESLFPKAVRRRTALLGK